MISQAVEYSLRAMVILTQSSDQPVTVQAMSQRGQIPAPYLSKLLQSLQRMGLIVSQRGVNGGYKLARAAKTITLADIVNAIEPIQRIKACPLGIVSHTGLCPLHRRLDQAMAAVEKAFVETNLADLCRESCGSIPLCDSQAVVRLEMPHAQGSVPP